MPLVHKLERLIDDLAIVEDPQERLAAVIDRAKKLPPLTSAERIDSNRVHGCVSVVWLIGELREGRCVFRSDADSPVVRGLLAQLCEFFSGATPEQIAAFDPDPLEALGLTRHLSPTRRNGLAAARAVVRAFARRHVATTAAAP